MRRHVHVQCVPKHVSTLSLVYALILRYAQNGPCLQRPCLRTSAVHMCRILRSRLMHMRIEICIAASMQADLERIHGERALRHLRDVSKGRWVLLKPAVAALRHLRIVCNLLCRARMRGYGRSTALGCRAGHTPGHQAGHSAGRSAGHMRKVLGTWERCWEKCWVQHLALVLVWHVAPGKLHHTLHDRVGILGVAGIVVAVVKLRVHVGLCAHVCPTACLGTCPAIRCDNMSYSATADTRSTLCLTRCPVA